MILLGLEIRRVHIHTFGLYFYYVAPCIIREIGLVMCMRMFSLSYNVAWYPFCMWCFCNGFHFWQHGRVWCSKSLFACVKFAAVYIVPLETWNFFLDVYNFFFLLFVFLGDIFASLVQERKLRNSILRASAQCLLLCWDFEHVTFEDIVLTVG